MNLNEDREGVVRIEPTWMGLQILPLANKSKEKCHPFVAFYGHEEGKTLKAYDSFAMSWELAYLGFGWEVEKDTDLFFFFSRLIKANNCIWDCN